jgi:hypothetical protein
MTLHDNTQSKLSSAKGNASASGLAPVQPEAARGRLAPKFLFTAIAQNVLRTRWAAAVAVDRV